ncbi:thromboxane A2 receptor-like isoform X2 [Ostrea edulis]|uniref:thromboxane A2 receptor-like isoform X2 n=1 Tax=Ostrea edulis TaxID=37623 RepID=UPI0024AFEFB3|nr:thromboxane A2 receptor-like isoform X2 [Ostrea edulis]
MANDIEESGVPAYVLFALGLLGNGLALGVICWNRENHQWRSFYIFFVGLAVSDFLNQMVMFPVTALRYASDFDYEISPQICQLMSFFYAFTQISSGIIIAGITTDQYLFLMIGQSLDTMQGNRRIYILFLCVIWIVSALVSSLHLFIGTSQVFYPGSWCFVDVTDGGIGNITSALFYSLTGIAVLIYTVSLNVCIVYKSYRNPEHRCHLVDANRITGFYDFHVNMFLAVSVTVYVICWGPFLIFLSLHAYTSSFHGGSKFSCSIDLLRVFDVKYR